MFITMVLSLRLCGVFSCWGKGLTKGVYLGKGYSCTYCVWGITGGMWSFFSLAVLLKTSRKFCQKIRVGLYLMGVAY